MPVLPLFIAGGFAMHGIALCSAVELNYAAALTSFVVVNKKIKKSRGVVPGFSADSENL
jgi:hypothetical protein